MSEIDDKFFAERKEKISAAWKRYTEDISNARQKYEATKQTAKSLRRKEIDDAYQAWLAASIDINPPVIPYSSKGGPIFDYLEEEKSKEINESQKEI